MIDWIIISFTVAFLILAPNNTELAGHFLGWTLFFGYMDITLLWAYNRWFGKYIYMTFHVIKAMLKSLIVYSPCFLAFAFAFHCFLFGADNRIFHTSRSSLLKVMVMTLGEFDFDENFLPDVVKEAGGRNWSTQVKYYLFILLWLFLIMKTSL